MSALRTETRFSAILRPNPQERPPVWDTWLAHTAHFVAVPSVGAIVPGWVMIIPKMHVLSFRCLCSDFWPELEDFVSYVSKILEGSFGPVTLFEHGTTQAGSVNGCGVDHAHLHLVPLAKDILENACADSSVTWRQISSWHLMQTELSIDSDYLLLSTPGGTSIVCDKSPKISQYFRQLIAERCFVSGMWNYKEYLFVENVLTTIAAFRNDPTLGNVIDAPRFMNGGDVERR